MDTTTQTRLDLINAYDDDDGVNESCHRILTRVCREHGWHDIADKVEGHDGRYYLGENDAEDLRTVGALPPVPLPVEDDADEP